MADRADITPELLRQLLRYEPETGKLFWKERPLDFNEPLNVRRRLNTQFKDLEAGTINNNGYRVIFIKRKHFTAHRVAWAVHYGSWPIGQIDHINHNKADNSIFNLRDISYLENNWNRSKMKNNSSGINGLYFERRTQKWHARICKNNKRVSLGRFNNKVEAARVLILAKTNFNFHENHGV